MRVYCDGCGGGLEVTLISVILPTYNRAQSLRRAIDSVLAQTHQELELIVADDASTDGTAALLATIHDPRLRHLRCPRNGGPGYARNRGVEAARGEVLAFQDSDDEWVPEKLQEQWLLLQVAPAEVAMVCGAYIAHFPDGHEMRVRAPGQEKADVETDILAGWCGIPPSWLLRRDRFDAIGGFDEGLPNREDWDLVLRMSGKWKVLPQTRPLTHKHTTAGSLEHDRDKRVTSGNIILARHAARFATVPAITAGHWYRIARTQIQLGDAAGARQALRKAMQSRPGQIKLIVVYVALLFGIGLFRGAARVRRRLLGLDQGH